jgi:VanZ family protein
MRQRRGLKIVGLLCVLAIVAASLVPGYWRPHSGASKGLEHFSAYAICGAMMALGFPRLRQMLALAGSLVLISALLEIVQTWIVERTPFISDFVASSLGAFSGLSFGACASRLLADKRRRASAAPSGPPHATQPER